MLRKVTEFIEKYHMIEEGDLVATGVSGGADSLCLLFMLLEYQKKVPFDLVVVHINHLIRREAGADAELVRKLCEKEQIPFYLQEIPVKTLAKERKISEEEAGRQARYQAFNDALEKYKKTREQKTKIAVAHHRGDNAETLLFHLFRGTGIWGMSGILPVNHNIIRPLLGCGRMEIEDYLNKKKVEWCRDATNEEDIYTRNKIRHHILPYARQEINEKSEEHLAGAALQMAELRHYLEGEIEKMAGAVTQQVRGNNGIRIERLLKYPLFLQHQCILWFLEKQLPGRKDITSEHLHAIYALLQKKGNKKMDLPGKFRVVKEYGTLWVEPKKKEEWQEEKRTIEISLQKEGKYLLESGEVLEISLIEKERFHGIEENKYTKYLDYDRIDTCLKLRYRQPGDYLVVGDQGQKKLLKEYFINEKIPSSMRGEIPLMADGSHILWIIGYRISAYYKVTENTKKIIQMKLRRGEHGRDN